MNFTVIGNLLRNRELRLPAYFIPKSWVKIRAHYVTRTAVFCWVVLSFLFVSSLFILAIWGSKFSTIMLSDVKGYTSIFYNLQFHPAYPLHSPFSTTSPPATLSMMAHSPIRTRGFYGFDVVVNIDSIWNIYMASFFGSNGGKNNWNEKNRWKVQAHGSWNVFHLGIRGSFYKLPLWVTGVADWTVRVQDRWASRRLQRFSKVLAFYWLRVAHKF